MVPALREIVTLLNGVALETETVVALAMERLEATVTLEKEIVEVVLVLTVWRWFQGIGEGEVFE